ncbi:MAG TPA: hypothetical protein VEQ60_04825, partial [Longimicrobium sp.]|nr:hypothetical protein [Longimicrobium sp.]
MAKAHTLVDNFNDNSIDAGKWISTGPVQETNQRLEILPASNVPQSYGRHTSASTYDLTSSEVSVEFVRLTRSGDSYLAAYTGNRDTGDSVAITAGFRYLQPTKRVAGVFTSLAVVPYNPRAHRWLRLRENVGTLYYEASADGNTWNEIARTPTPFSLTSVTLEIAAGVFASTASPGLAVFDNFNVQDTSRARRVEERRRSARDIRVEAAEVAAARRHDEHANNNDEVNYPDRPFIGSYSKALRHDALGDPEPLSYGSLLRALESRDPGDFEEILQPPNAVKLTNPQAGLAFDLEGPDAQAVTQPPAPRFDSEHTAAEM